MSIPSLVLECSLALLPGSGGEMCREHAWRWGVQRLRSSLALLLLSPAVSDLQRKACLALLSSCNFRGASA